MSAIYILAGVFTGIASTALAMGADGRIGILFVPSIGLALIGSSIEYNMREK